MISIDLVIAFTSCFEYCSSPFSVNSRIFQKRPICFALLVESSLQFSGFRIIMQACSSEIGLKALCLVSAELVGALMGCHFNISAQLSASDQAAAVTLRENGWMKSGYGLRCR